MKWKYKLFNKINSYEIKFKPFINENFHDE